MNYIISPNLVRVNKEDKVYAYHSQLGNLRELRKDEVEFLDNILSGRNSSDENSLSTLLASGFVLPVSHETQERDNDVTPEYKARIVSGESITKLLLMVTEKCMLNCSYCYIPDSPGYINNNQKKDMSWEVAKEAIDVFRTIIKRNGQRRVHVRFHGGEPLLNFQVIKRSILYIEALFAEIDVVFHINTNGVVMNREIASFLCHHEVNVEVSLDGVREVHNSSRPFVNGTGSFDYAIAAIEKLREYNPSFSNINLAVTLCKSNYMKLNDIVDLAVQLKLTEIEVNTLLFEHPLDILEDIDARVDCLVKMRIYGASKGVSVRGKWFKLYEHLFNPVLNYCGRMGQQIGVNNLGEVFLCTGLMQSFGHISKWDEIVNSPEYLSICMRVVGNIADCRNCPIEGMCAGGCTASVVKSHGQYNAAEEKECKFRIKMVEELIRNSDRICNNMVGIEKADNSYIPLLKNEVK